MATVWSMLGCAACVIAASCRGIPRGDASFCTLSDVGARTGSAVGRTPEQHTDAQAAYLPDLIVDIAYGSGDLDIAIDDSNLHGSSSTVFTRIRVEGYASTGLGGGLRCEILDADSFDSPVFEPTEPRDLDLFLFIGSRTPTKGVACPLRAGLLLNKYSLEGLTTGSEAEYTSIGARFEFEPDIPLVASERMRWSLYGMGNLGGAVTRVETSPSNVDGDTLNLLFGVEVGTRLAIGHFTVGAAWVYRGQRIAENNDEDGAQLVTIFAADTDFSGFLLSAGAVF